MDNEIDGKRVSSMGTLKEEIAQRRAITSLALSYIKSTLK